jgi:hypothetical protein
MLWGEKHVEDIAGQSAKGLRGASEKRAKNCSYQLGGRWGRTGSMITSERTYNSREIIYNADLGPGWLGTGR